MPISDELQDLVGNPVPSSDLGQRARQRATKIKRRRLAGIATVVAAVAVIAVPSAILASGSGQVTGTAGAGSASPQPDTAKSPAAAPASAQGSESAEQAAKKAAFASLNGGSFQKPTTVKLEDGTLTAADNARVSHAQQLLGAPLRGDGVQVEVDATTGARLGIVANFVATAGGGTVSIKWEPLAIAHVGHPSKAAGEVGGTVTKTGQGTDDIKAAVAGQTATGVSVSSDTMQISMKVLQGSPGSAPILPGDAADTVAHALLASEQ